MKYAALFSTLLVLQGLQDLPEPVQKTVTKELGEKPQIKVQKESDGSFTVDTRNTSLHILASGDLISRDDQITVDRMPKPVQQTVSKELGSKKIDAHKITKVSYEAQAGNVTLKMAEDGSILKREESIKPADVPAAVAKAARAKLEGSAVSKAKKITEDGHVRYKVTVETMDKKKHEASFQEDGTEIVR